MRKNIAKQFHRWVHKNHWDNVASTIPEDHSLWPREWVDVQFKAYDRLPTISLPSYRPIYKSFDEIQKQRVSTREFDRNSSTIELGNLSTLLHYSAGLNHNSQPLNDEQKTARRFYPSGGARYPIETYLDIRTVDGIAPGVYHYNIKNHALELLLEKNLYQKYESGLYRGSPDAHVILIITCVWDRSFIKYQDFGYLLALREAGHLMQNLLLAGTALNLNVCPSAGYYPEAIEEMLCIDGNEESPVYIALLGK